VELPPIMPQVFVRTRGGVACRGWTVRARDSLRSKFGATRDVSVRSDSNWSVRRAGEASDVPSKTKNQIRTKRDASIRSAPERATEKREAP
jgi:hypothetical protein